MIPALLLSLVVAMPPNLHVAPEYALNGPGLASRQVTEVTLISAAVTLLILEAVIVYERDHGRSEPTISMVMRDWGSRYGALPWTIGVLAGHWFWNRKDWIEHDDAMSRAKALVALSAAVVLWDALDGRPRPWRAPVMLFLGIGAGHFLWPQAEIRF